MTEGHTLTVTDMILLLLKLPPEMPLKQVDYPEGHNQKVVRAVTGVNEHGEVTLSQEFHAYFHDDED